MIPALLLATSLLTPQEPTQLTRVLPFREALHTAKAEHRLVFLKPVYGGIDEAGASNYCAGTW